MEVELETKTVYPTLEQLNHYKQLMKKYKLTEHALMKHQSGHIYDNNVKVLSKLKPC